jgi:histidinol-phosphate/aromatic aminotransferase/cobyric acid decarboxylase-like protein
LIPGPQPRRSPHPWAPEASRRHGGASLGAIGARFESLERRAEIIAADVLDAWFPPAPGVVSALAEEPAWLVRTSPPPGCEGLIDAIAEARGLPPECIALGAGSLDLIFRAFHHWLRPRSRVLLLDPTYGEYAHVLDRVIGCRVERFPLERAAGWAIDPGRLRRAVAGGHDLVALVNPNNPTGRHLPRRDLERILEAAPRRTRIWIDEAYVDYAGEQETLESLAAAGRGAGRILVCKSMSKIYALSGLRAAYPVTSPTAASELRRWTPPWALSLPAQIAEVRALADPAYYRARRDETRRLRAELAAGLRRLDAVEVDESVANSVPLTISPCDPSATELCRRARERGLCSCRRLRWRLGRIGIAGRRR